MVFAMALLALPGIAGAVKGLWDETAPIVRTAKWNANLPNGQVKFTDVTASWTAPQVQELKNKGAWPLVEAGSDQYDLRTKVHGKKP